MSVENPDIESGPSLLEGLGNIVGQPNLLVDDENRLFYSTDVYRRA
ncbi:uncharacterized protein METZ01_LOCUS250560, partial [marine metagenome]